ncbi:hypothetical protein ACPYO6_07280 [Georgenia sp. Z1344]|uniref:hypothetical protein n=1 Tax=Georgenia sp. Z1344 TaxID=3416706 RepID=UPI003CF88366
MGDARFRPPPGGRDRRREPSDHYLRGYGIEREEPGHGGDRTPVPGRLDSFEQLTRRHRPEVGPTSPAGAGHDPSARPADPATTSGPQRATRPSGFRADAPHASRYPAMRGVRIGTRTYGPVTLALVVVLLLVGLALSFSTLVGTSPDPDPPPGGGPADEPSPAATDFPVLWQAEVAALSDLADAQLRGNVDGSFDDEGVLDSDGAWAVVAQDPETLEAELVGVDPGTGEPTWTRALSHVLCARNPAPGGDLACLEATGTDDDGLGTAWTAHLIDPTTGESTGTAEIEGYLSSLYVLGDTLVVLDQPAGGTDVVLHGYDADSLEPTWSLELGPEVSDAMLAGDQRIVVGGTGERGDALIDRPRWRPVAETVLALGAGQRTAIVDVGAGELVTAPPCTRFSTDGSTMWCNEPGAGIVAMEVDGTELWRDPHNRLAATTALDPDTRVVPLVLDGDRRLLRYDLGAGRADSVLLDPGVTDTFAGTLEPGGEVAGEHVLVRGEPDTHLLSADRSDVVGVVGEELFPEGVLERGDTLVVDDGDLVAVDPGTAAVVDTWGAPSAGYLEPVGDAVVLHGSEELVRLDW